MKKVVIYVMFLQIFQNGLIWNIMYLCILSTNSFRTWLSDDDVLMVMKI